MNKGKLFLQEIRDNIIVGDGAYGTELFANSLNTKGSLELLNLIAPNKVLELHEKYIRAGSRLIETNTFAANRINLEKCGAEKDYKEILQAGVKLAKQAANNKIYVAGSIGPLPHIEGEAIGKSEQTEIFREQISILLNSGVDVLLFETFTKLSEIANALKVARSLAIEVPIIAQMAFENDGLTTDGTHSKAFMDESIAIGVDVIGSNCGSGASSVVTAIRQMASHKKPLSAYINAGYAEKIEGRHVFVATADYIAEKAIELVNVGVKLVGGCCGTNPATIKAISQRLSQKGLSAKKYYQIETQDNIISAQAGTLSQTDKIKIPSSILVELDPPRNLNIEEVIDSALKLKNAGVKNITIADNPLATVRIDVISTASILKQHTGLFIIPHLTGRDRNKIALQSSIMAAHVQGIRSFLCVTGDPIRMYHETNTTGVFDVNSISLVRLISDFNRGVRLKDNEKTSFAIGVALNPNVRDIKGQIDKLKRKIDSGAHYILTQPIYNKNRLDLLLNTLSAGKINLPVFTGILPLTSAKNANFLHNEVPGIVIPEYIRTALNKYGSLEDQRKQAREVIFGLVESYSEVNKYFYLITPGNKTEYVLPIVKTILKKTETIERKQQAK